MQPPNDSRPKGPSKKTSAVVERILSVLEAGGTLAMAAAAVRISDDTLKRWRDDDPDFDHRVITARCSGGAEILQRIQRAAKRGEWRADAWLMERMHPETHGSRILLGGVAGADPIKIESSLELAAKIRANPEATIELHALLGAAVERDASDSLDGAHTQALNSNDNRSPRRLH